MRVDPSYITVKDIRKGKTVRRQFTIFNDGRKDLVIRHVKASANISTPLKAGTSIPAGRSVTVDVKVTAPKVTTSQVQESVYIITNDPLRPQKEIVIRTITK